MKKISAVTWLLFGLAILATYLVGLNFPFLGPDEARYAQVAREMFNRADVITPTLGNHTWFEKPALLYWLQMLGYKLFGISETAARIGSAVFGLLIISGLWFVGYNTARFSNSKFITPKDKFHFANWLALIAASSIGIIVFARAASFDIIVTLPITVSLTSFYVHQIAPKNTLTYFVALVKFYLHMGLALLAKGLIGVLFPLSIVIVFFIVRRRIPNKYLRHSLGWGLLLTLLVAGIWYFPIYLVNGWQFVHEFFILHHFQRFYSNKFLHPQPFWFFWVVLPLMTLPWTGFFIISAFRAFRDRVREFFANESPDDSVSQLSTLAIIWVMLPLLFFSLSGSKLPGYILPAVPPAAILSALAVWKFIKHSRIREFYLQLLAIATFAVIAGLLAFVLPKFVVNDTSKYLVQASNAEGYTTQRIANYGDISHSLEFYGAGRLIRDNEGKQIRFDSIDDLKPYISDSDGLLVYLPPQYIRDFENNSSVRATVIDKNTEHAMILVENIPK
ncbi:MAG: phospholipid carrier-dependent glycosyltransferase [Pyrinomonadaceae bacterium]